MKIKQINISSDSAVSFFAFGEHWNAIPDYHKAIPVGKKNWHSIKDSFYENNSHEKPLLMDIQKKDGTLTSVYLYGFRIPEAPIVISFGSDATQNRCALCRLVSTDDYIAILW